MVVHDVTPSHGSMGATFDNSLLTVKSAPNPACGGTDCDVAKHEEAKEVCREVGCKGVKTSNEC